MSTPGASWLVLFNGRENGSQNYLSEEKKALKEAGTPHVPQKKPKIIEEHYDDCAEDLSSLKGIDLESHTNEYSVLSEHWADRQYVTDEDSDDDEMGENKQHFQALTSVVKGTTTPTWESKILLPAVTPDMMLLFTCIDWSVNPMSSMLRATPRSHSPPT